MTDLIASLERGPGSRELSDQVLLALGWEVIRPNDDGEFGWILDDPITGRRLAGYWSNGKQPDPSRNLQDMMDLLPEGYSASLQFDGPGDVYVFLWDRDENEFQSGENCRTLALGGCIALLRAAQIKGREE